MKLTRYRVKANDDSQCSACGYPIDTGDYLWYDPVGQGFYCSMSCAATKHGGKSPYTAHMIADYGGANDQCGHVSSDADPGL